MPFPDAWNMLFRDAERYVWKDGKGFLRVLNVPFGNMV